MSGIERCEAGDCGECAACRAVIEVVSPRVGARKPPRTEAPTAPAWKWLDTAPPPHEWIRVGVRARLAAPPPEHIAPCLAEGAAGVVVKVGLRPAPRDGVAVYLHWDVPGVLAGVDAEALAPEPLGYVPPPVPPGPIAVGTRVRLANAVTSPPVAKGWELASGTLGTVTWSASADGGWAAVKWDGVRSLRGLPDGLYGPAEERLARLADLELEPEPVYADAHEEAEADRARNDADWLAMENERDKP